MKRIFTLAAVIFASAVLMSACCGEKRRLPKDIDAKAIDKTVTAWLSKMDKGYFQQCYDETAQTLKTTLDKKQWLDNMAAYRKPLGEAEKRKEINMFYENQLQNAKEGDYVIAQYAAVFQQKIAVVESVTLVKEQDGSWKVFGYSLK
ncbi:MAG: DUF4019 domain-containing protein [Endomicrobium sp.]|jgi:hypothetical protein|nr:DUF4019 domain-containing protein [Endomicrobium sp.]